MNKFLNTHVGLVIDTPLFNLKIWNLKNKIRVFPDFVFLNLYLHLQCPFKT